MACGVPISFSLALCWSLLRVGLCRGGHAEPPLGLNSTLLERVSGHVDGLRSATWDGQGCLSGRLLHIYPIGGAVVLERSLFHQ